MPISIPAASSFTVNAGHALAAGLVAAFVFNEAGDEVNLLTAAAATNAGLTYGSNASGGAIFSDAQADKLTLAAADWAGTSSAAGISVVMLAHAAAGTTSVRRAIHCGPNLLDNVNNGWLFGCGRSGGSANEGTFGYATSGGGYQTLSTAVGSNYFDTSTTRLYGVTFNDGADCRFYRDAALFETVTGAGTRLVAQSDKTLNLFQRPDAGASRNWGGSCNLLLIYNRSLSAQDHTDIMAQLSAIDSNSSNLIYTASASQNATANGATLTGASSLAAGAASGTAAGTAPGTSLSGGSSLAAGSATGGSALQFVVSADRLNWNLATSSIAGSDVYIRPRVKAVEGEAASQFFHAGGITGASGVTPVFRLEKAAMRGFIPSKQMWSYDGETWNFFDNLDNTDGTWFRFWNNAPFAQATVYVGTHAVWSISRISNKIAAVGASPYVSQTPSSTAFVAGQTSARTREDAQAIPAQPLFAFRLTDAAAQPANGRRKKRVVLMAGTHPGEDTGDTTFWGAVDFLLSADAAAVVARREFEFFCYPAMFPAARYGGAAHRSDYDPVYPDRNSNRYWHNDSLATIAQWRTIIPADVSGAMDVNLDFHGASAGGLHGYFETYLGTSGKAELNTVLSGMSPTGGFSDTAVTTPATTNRWAVENVGAVIAWTPESAWDTNASVATLQAWGANQIKALASPTLLAWIDARVVTHGMAPGAGLAGTSTLQAGAAAGMQAGSAPGATLSGASSLAPGVATGTQAGAAPGATLNGASALQAGTATGGGLSPDAAAPGANLTGSGQLSPGPASGNQDATAPGAQLNGAGSLSPGSAAQLRVVRAPEGGGPSLIRTTTRRPASAGGSRRM